jgi:hypothetical protein
MEGKALVPVRAGVVGQADQHDGEGGGVAVLAGDGCGGEYPSGWLRSSSGTTAHGVRQ